MAARKSAIRRLRRASRLKVAVSQSYRRLKVPKPSVHGIYTYGLITFGSVAANAGVWVTFASFADRRPKAIASRHRPCKP